MINNNNTFVEFEDRYKEWSIKWCDLHLKPQQWILKIYFRDCFHRIWFESLEIAETFTKELQYQYNRK